MEHLRMEDQGMDSLFIDHDRCIGCVRCMMACPTKAVRVRQRKAVILDDLCIDCGVCVTACERGAIVPRIDTFEDLSRKFKVKIALPSPVLYSQFGGNILPNDILRALKAVGFDDVCDEAYICEVVGFLIERYTSEHKTAGLPFISSLCPVVIRLIQKRFHDLIPLIIPIEAPREVAARELKQRYAKKLGVSEEEIAVVYITPCSAKINAIKVPPTRKRSHLDSAIAIKEVYGLIVRELMEMKDRELVDEEFYLRASGAGFSWAMSGGEIAEFGFTSSIAVSGIRNVIRILEDIDRGRFKNLDCIALRACEEGCLGGNLTVENRYIAKMKLLRLVEMFGKSPRFDKEKLLQAYKEHSTFEREPHAIKSVPIDTRRDSAITKLNQVSDLMRGLGKIDCGACGSPDCRTFAEDVVCEQALAEQCPFWTGSKP